MIPTRSFARSIGLVAVCIGVFATPRLVLAQVGATEVTQQSMAVQMRNIAQQLGTKLNPEQPQDLAVGVTLNGSLQEPEKLEKLGLVGLHKGARVTAMRVGPQKLIVEADELDPVPLTRKTTLRIDEQGRLNAP